MENIPLDNLPPETRQRVENALRALGGGALPQNVFVTQSPPVSNGNMPPLPGQQTNDVFGNISDPFANVRDPFGNTQGSSAHTPGMPGNTPGAFWSDSGTPGNAPGPYGSVAGGGGNTPGMVSGEKFPPLSQIFQARFANMAGQHTRHGEAWAHWEYDPQEWALFDQVDWVPVRNKARQKLIGGPIICVALIGAILGVTWLVSQSSTLVFIIGLTSAILLLTALMLLMVSAGNSMGEAKKRYQARQNQAEPHRVTLSEKGVWEAGTFFAVNEILMDLKSVKLTANPPVLHFKMLKADLGGNGGNAGTTERLQVLVPRGHEGEAEQLRQRYYTEVIKAKSTYNPREPD